MNMEKTSEVLKYLNKTVPCYGATIYNENGMWKGTNPLVDTIPLFIVQLTIAILVTRLFLLAFESFFHQPLFIAEIIGGMFLGPSGLGRYHIFTDKLFPTGSFMVLDPMAHFALIHYAFILGLEMDLTTIRFAGQKALVVGIAGFLFPIAMGSGLFFMLGAQTDAKMGFMFWATTLTVTGSSVLPHLLETLKILHTETGKTALSSSLINDFCSWFLLALSILVSGKIDAIHWSLLSTTAFLLICIYYLRPSISWFIRRTPEGLSHGEFYLCSFLAVGVGLCGVLTDACGTHPVIGAFVFGLTLPKGEMELHIVERVQGFVSGILMPVFFAAVGNRIDVDGIAKSSSWVMVALVVILACSAKILSTLFSGFICGMRFKEAISLGVVMNTKSLFAFMILQIGMEQKALTTQSYTVMVLAVLVMTMIVTPITLSTQHKSKFVMYKRRTIQKSKPNEDLRVLVCVHGLGNVPAIVNLLEALDATRDSRIHVFALQLIELIGRASAIRVVHQSSKTLSRNLGNVETDQIVATFDNYARRNESVSVHQLLVRSAYSTMDEEICSVAEEKHAAFIILPFHTQHGTVGEILEKTNPAIRDVNENVLASAPCSVGILINRGVTHTGNFASRVVMLYFGGPDDREALSFAWRIAKHPEVTLKVVRFLPIEDPALTSILDPMDFMSRPHEVVAMNIEREREKQLDDAFLDKFRIATEANTSMQYIEMVLENEEETVKVIKSMDHCYDLFIVGRGGGGVTSPLTGGLADWCDCPELGAVGDVLVTSEFSSAFAVLVVQQYGILGPRRSTDLMEGTSSSINQGGEIGSMAWPTTSVEEGGGGGGRFDSFASRSSETVYGY